MITDPKKRPAPWSPEENKALVALYFRMLDAAMAGRPYIKAAMIREVQGNDVPGEAGPLQMRTKQSIEFKLMNASAAHQHLDFGESMHNHGYRAMPNYQAALKVAMRDEIVERKAAHTRALGISSTASRYGSA